MAVTPDERFLAYVTRRNRISEKQYEKCPVDDSVRIRDLSTGEERGWPIAVDSFVRDVTVSPDGRYVVYSEAFGRIERIDTRTGEKVVVYDAGKGVSVVTRSSPSCSVRAVSYLPSGELAAAVACQESFVATYDPVTRRLGRELFRLPPTFKPDRLDFDGTGQHAFLVGREREGSGIWGYDNAVYRWDAGGEPRLALPATAEPGLTEPAW